MVASWSSSWSSSWIQRPFSASIVVLLLAAAAAGAAARVRQLDHVYHEYPSLTALLQDYADAYPQLTRLVSIGQTVEGRELWVLRITDQPDTEEQGEPKFKYIGNIHGDEKVGREVLLHYIDWLLTGYGVDANVTELVDQTDIYILPSLNPDGAVVGRRGNSRNIDLNRNFPDEFIDPEDSTVGREPETAAVMNWLAATPFVLSAQLHGGTLVVNYPRSANDSSTPSPYYATAPDDDFFVEVASVYANAHPTMSDSVQFPGGITNGAMWYVIYGGMQDFNYLYRGCFEFTIELSNVKTPQESQLESFWDANREPLYLFNQHVHRGFKGTVVDATTGQPLRATIRVRDNAYSVTSDPSRFGDYFRLLPAGSYTVSVEADGYETASFPVTVPDFGQGAAILNVRLEPSRAH